MEAALLQTKHQETGPVVEVTQMWTKTGPGNTRELASWAV